MGGSVGIILAGGQARRMGGGAKGRLPVGGVSILARTIACLRPQVEALAISANEGGLEDFGVAVLADHVGAGPLAGVLAGLEWAAQLDADWLLTVPGDCPFLPHDLLARLAAGRGEAVMAAASSGGRVHPVVALWPVGGRGALRAAVLGGVRKVSAFVGDRAAVVEWPTIPHDPFLNVNTPEDLVAANQVALRRPGGPGS